MPGQMEGRKDGETLFYRTLPATARGPTRQYLIGVLSLIREITRQTIEHNFYLFKVMVLNFHLEWLDLGLY